MITIPEQSFRVHEEIAADFINQFGRNCTLIFPPIKTKCPNCTGGTNYISGGPIPFTNGSICPWCSGNDFVITESTDTIKLLLYFSPKEWINYTIEAQIANSLVQSRGLISDLPKLERASYIIIHSGIQGFGEQKFEKYGDWVPFGARLKTEFLQMWKRSS